MDFGGFKHPEHPEDRQNNKGHENFGGSVPLCRFGPGGDFVRQWPGGDSVQSAKSGNPLGRLLAAIAEMVGATLDRHVIDELMGRAEDVQGPIIIHSAGEQSHEYEIANRTTDAKTVADTAVCPKLQKQKLLFADDCRDGRAAGRKSAHRVRAHRRASAKAAAYEAKGQGTLFELNTPSQSAA